MLSQLYKGQDPSSLGVMRFLFGLLMILDIPQERGMTFLPHKWSDPDICYFPLFNWLQPLPLEWMYMVYSVMMLGALGIMLGFMYRLSCLSFVISYWYIFLLDKTSWNNHSYLYGLTAFMLLLTDAHHYWSIDGLLRPSIRNVDVPRWHYGIFKFQFIIVYFYAGLKKLDLDWVFGYSMTGLSREWVFDPFRLLGLPNHIIDHYVVHICGLVLDLSEGFLLFFDKTRPIGFFFGCSFHLMNSQMFHIGMFPWTMMATMPIFCYPNWPKKWIRSMPNAFAKVLPAAKEAKANIICSNADKGRIPIRQWCIVAVASLYVMVQTVLPYSHSVTKGYNAWTQGLYGYSWDMMVHSWSTQHVVVKVVDGNSGATTYLQPGAFTTGTKNKRWNSHPDMLKQYAHCLAKKIEQSPQLGIQQPRIYFDVWRSLNKRFQQRLVDPNIDIVTAPWSPTHQTPWIRPLLTGLTPWRNKLHQIKTETYEKNNISDVTFVADFPGLFLENYIDDEVKANLTVLHGMVNVEFDGKNQTLGVNDSIRLPSNETHFVYVVSDTPACYMYESFNVTWQQNVTESDNMDEEFSKRAKEAKEWKEMSKISQFKLFLSRKVKLFKISFEGAYRSFLVISNRFLDKNLGKQ